MKSCIVITTKNRKEVLFRAITSALYQTGLNDIIVIDDGSTDGTSAMVKSEFPQVQLELSSSSRGYIVQRNRAASLSSADVILSIDDDATFSSPSVLQETLAAFGHPRVAAVAIPYTEPQKDRHIYQKAPSEGIWVTDTFRGTAYAILRRVFNEIGGYREELVHQGEESDFCIRLLNHGFVVRLGFSDHVVHDEMPIRDWTRMDYHGRRNDILFAWNNVPERFFLKHLLGTTLRGVRLSASSMNWSMIRGIVSGYCLAGRYWKARQPVSVDAYRLHRDLKKRGPRCLSEIQNLLPPLKVPAC